MSQFFGVEQDGWNIGEGGNGKVGISLFASAVQVWSHFQGKAVTVAAAAAAFNVHEAMIVEAVEWHPWMFLSGSGPSAIIEHEGE